MSKAVICTTFKQIWIDLNFLIDLVYIFKWDFASVTLVSNYDPIGVKIVMGNLPGRESQQKRETWAWEYCLHI